MKEIMSSFYLSSVTLLILFCLLFKCDANESDFTPRIAQKAIGCYDKFNRPQVNSIFNVNEKVSK